MDKHQVLDIIEEKTKKLTGGYVKYAKLAMVEIERNDLSSFVLLKNEELRTWWTNEMKRVSQREEKHAKAVEQYDIKMAAWDRLSVEERKILGIRKPVRPKKAAE